ncbi:MAG: hypothetical protein AAGE52_24050 [Myxococcota bacterium]
MADEPEDASEPDSRRRIAVGLGWVSGAVLVLLLNYILFVVVGDSYPVEPTSFVAVVVGAFGGMAVADRLGDRAFRILGITTGFVVALALTVAVVLAR